MSLTLTSPAFDSGNAIPYKYSKDGENISPPLKWAGAPDGTQSFALVIEDPDAPKGTFLHWAVYNIPADQNGLSEGEELSAFGRGINGFGNDGYDGPRPPRGHGVHHYHFRLAALDADHLHDVPQGATAMMVWDEALRHTIEEAELIGTYESK